MELNEMDKPANRIVMIVGPTAVGKSDLGIYLMVMRIKFIGI